jgi:hypothetical protein
MNPPPFPPLDLKKLQVLPLAQRKSLTRVEDILVDPDSPAPPLTATNAALIHKCARDIVAAQSRHAAIMLLYGAHLLRNGAALILEQMMAHGWLSHLATNGAGSIHDWEYAFLGRSTESVEENVAAGTFGTWDETGRFLHLALLTGALRSLGYGCAVGTLIFEEHLEIPTAFSLEESLRNEPSHPLSPARAELLQAILHHSLPPGPIDLPHPWKHASIFAQAFRHKIPLTVHPGIGYDIISNHPMFNGAAIGRAATHDFRQFGAAVEHLDGGVVLSVGSAIMGPQVFEKSLSCVHNLRFQSGRPPVRDHTIYVVDLQDGGDWDWTRGEPPKNNPAYYLRFCKSYSRMGGTMHYACCHNLAFIHNLYHELLRL